MLLAGFHHSDLRLANVMEIKPLEPTAERVEETPSERRLSANLDRLQARESGKDKGVLLREKLRHQFKIIDYGLANFDETFAAGPDVVVDVCSCTLKFASHNVLAGTSSSRHSGASYKLIALHISADVFPCTSFLQFDSYCSLSAHCIFEERNSRNWMRRWCILNNLLF